MSPELQRLADRLDECCQRRYPYPKTPCRYAKSCRNWWDDVSGDLLSVNQVEELEREFQEMTSRWFHESPAA